MFFEKLLLEAPPTQLTFWIKCPKCPCPNWNLPTSRPNLFLMGKKDLWLGGKLNLAPAWLLKMLKMLKDGHFRAKKPPQLAERIKCPKCLCPNRNLPTPRPNLFLMEIKDLWVGGKLNLAPAWLLKMLKVLKNGHFRAKKSPQLATRIKCPRSSPPNWYLSVPMPNLFPLTLGPTWVDRKLNLELGWLLKLSKMLRIDWFRPEKVNKKYCYLIRKLQSVHAGAKFTDARS